MKRTLLTIIGGLVLGLCTHATYFQIRQPADIHTLDGQLAWMKLELKISDSQLVQIKALHETSAPQLRALAAQVSQMQKELIAFENTRVKDGRVDFIEFARFVEARRNLNLEYIGATRQLVLASADLMTTSQRERYLGLVSSTIPLSEFPL